MESEIADQRMEAVDYIDDEVVKAKVDPENPQTMMPEEDQASPDFKPNNPDNLEQKDDSEPYSIDVKNSMTMKNRPKSEKKPATTVKKKLTQSFKKRWPQNF